MPGRVLGIEDKAMNKTNMTPASWGLEPGRKYKQQTSNFSVLHFS